MQNPLICLILYHSVNKFDVNICLIPNFYIISIFWFISEHVYINNHKRKIWSLGENPASPISYRQLWPSIEQSLPAEDSNLLLVVRAVKRVNSEVALVSSQLSLWFSCKVLYSCFRSEEIVMPDEHTGLVKDNYQWKVMSNFFQMISILNAIDLFSLAYSIFLLNFIKPL